MTASPTANPSPPGERLSDQLMVRVRMCCCNRLKGVKLHAGGCTGCSARMLVARCASQLLITVGLVRMEQRDLDDHVERTCVGLLFVSLALLLLLVSDCSIRPSAARRGPSRERLHTCMHIQTCVYIHAHARTACSLCGPSLLIDIGDHKQDPRTKQWISNVPASGAFVSPRCRRGCTRLRTERSQRCRSRWERDWMKDRNTTDADSCSRLSAAKSHAMSLFRRVGGRRMEGILLVQARARLVETCYGCLCVACRAA